MKNVTITALLALIVISCSVQERGIGESAQERLRIEPDDDPVLYAWANAETAAVRVVDETKRRCWERPRYLGETPFSPLRQGGLTIVKPEDNPDLLVVINPKGTRNEHQTCDIELHLSVHIYGADQINQSLPRENEIASVVGGTVSTKTGNTSQINDWIDSQSYLFMRAIIYQRNEAKMAVARSGFRWRITTLKSAKIFSRQELEEYIYRCGFGGQQATVKEGIIFANTFFIQCMRDEGAEIEYDNQYDVRACEWLETSSKRDGYHGELRCGSSH